MVLLRSALLFGLIGSVVSAQDYEWSRDKLTLTVSAVTEAASATWPSGYATFWQANIADILDQVRFNNTLVDNGGVATPSLAASIGVNEQQPPDYKSIATTTGSISSNPNYQDVFQVISTVNGTTEGKASTVYPNLIRALRIQSYGQQTGIFSDEQSIAPVSGRYRLTSSVHSNGHPAVGIVAFELTHNMNIISGVPNWTFEFEITLEVKCDGVSGTAPTENVVPDFYAIDYSNQGVQLAGWRWNPSYYEYEWTVEDEYYTAVDIVTFDGVDSFILPMAVGCVVDLWGTPFHRDGAESYSGQFRNPVIAGDQEGRITTIDLTVTASDP